MANPQKEDGYTAIANEIMEALAAFRIPGEARQVLDVILRKTYGCNKKEESISISEFASLTAMNRGNVSRAVKKLIELKMVFVKQQPKCCDIATPLLQYSNTSPKKITIYSFQKDYLKWENNCCDIATDCCDIATVTVAKKPLPPPQQPKGNGKFDEFWAAYPRKVGKGAAQKAWDVKKPPIEKVLSAISWQKESHDWTKEDGQFIPHPSTWLNQARWEDEPNRSSRPMVRGKDGKMYETSHSKVVL